MRHWTVRLLLENNFQACLMIVSQVLAGHVRRSILCGNKILCQQEVVRAKSKTWKDANCAARGLRLDE